MKTGLGLVWLLTNIMFLNGYIIDQYLSSSINDKFWLLHPISKLQAPAKTASYFSRFASRSKSLPVGCHPPPKFDRTLCLAWQIFLSVRQAFAFFPLF